jgi:hypothetical protein
VDRPHHVRTGDVEDLVAAFETREVVQAQVVGLQCGADRPSATSTRVARTPRNGDDRRSDMLNSLRPVVVGWSGE